MAAPGTVTGFPELDRRLEMLARRDARRIVRNGMNRAMTILHKAMRAAVPPAATKGHGQKRLKAALGKRYKKSRRSGEYEAKVGANVGKRRERQAPQWHLLMLGTADRYTGSVTRRSRSRIGRRTFRTVQEESTGNPRRFRGRIRGSEALRTAARAAEASAMQAMRQTVLEQLEKAGAGQPVSAERLTD